MSQPKKSEVELRDKAIMHQQRRLKQATQFTHKDSADLLPLDGLKRLGTSKNLQPHSIVQRRLLEGSIPQLARVARDTPSHIRSPLAESQEGPQSEKRHENIGDDSTEERESPEDSERSLRSDEEDEEDDEQDGDNSDTVGKSELKHKWTEVEMERGRAGTKDGEQAPSLSALQVQCKCGDAEVKVSINTGFQYNHISSTCCRRLGLKASPKCKPLSESTGNEMATMQLQFGKESVQCTAQVVDDEVFEICLGLQTLLELRCCVDLKTRVLRLQSNGEELPFLDTPSHSRCQHHDNNKNL